MALERRKKSFLGVREADSFTGVEPENFESFAYLLHMAWIRSRACVFAMRQDMHSFVKTENVRKGVRIFAANTSMKVTLNFVTCKDQIVACKHEFDTSHFFGDLVE